jgi:hypothetical protein
MRLRAIPRSRAEIDRDFTRGGMVGMRDHHHESTGGDVPNATFAEGQADPDRYRDDARPGRFSDGMEALGDDDPEKHALGSFADEDSV